jgi:hypothetical protein
MQCEAPDMHFYSEIRDFNLEFLGLVASGRRRCHGQIFGLDAAVVDQISRFNPAQLDAMAATPCLLTGFTGTAARLGLGVAEPLPAVDPEWGAHARLFAAGLLTYVWQTARRDALRAALCLGTADHLLSGETGFRDIRRHADRALQHLEGRFRCSRRFWPDLVRAAREGHPERLRLAHLTAIQLAMAEVRQVARQRFESDRPALAH